MSVFRYLLIRLFHFRRLSVGGMSMIGSRCGFYIKSGGNVSCAGRIILNDDVMIFSKGHLEIGKNLGVNSYSRIVTHEYIKIGDHVTIGQMVSILDHDHAYQMNNQGLQLNGYNTKPISIGNNVWIGDKCTILKGVNVGNNVIIGANTLVNKNIPDNSIVAGSPMKVIKSLKSHE